MKKSAGILVYHEEDKEIKVLLCHMGGPYWQNIDNGGWSLPKGEVGEEKVIDAAVREFQEETGFTTSKDKLEFLGSKKQSSRKLVIIFSTMNNFDASKAISNTFQKEWPKGSGIIRDFPEMDQAKWFDIETAKEKILKGQRYFLEKLETKLNQERDK